ncbi:zinc-ribbon domain-containing protein [Stecheria sp. CLA-KB-P133]|uniref:Zinc-ribbon domain-containing protein n=1 Tax=Grylomicrobium aquisgranensis TaxID=2926318 RepID=A0AB35U034_9FIRM|nr:zinc-ribbon domain-containing protein [Stecheria sp. CLA-KB-P133]
MKKCINCQEEIADDAAFCPFCGTKQPDLAETKTEPEEVKDEETKPAENTEKEKSLAAEAPKQENESKETEAPVENKSETAEQEAQKQEAAAETPVENKAESAQVKSSEPVEEVKTGETAETKPEEKTEPEHAAAPKAEKKTEPAAENVKMQMPKADIDWKMYLMPFWNVIRDPFAIVSLPWVDVGVAILLSLIVNTWLTRSFAVSTLEFVLQAVGRTDINVSIAMNNMGYTFSSFFQCGMVMTVIVIGFLFLARFISERKRANASVILQQISASLFFTSLLALLTIIFSAITPVLGTFGVLCLLVFEVLILHQDMQKINGWLQLIILTLFLILQVLAVYHMMPTNAWF